MKIIEDIDIWNLISSCIGDPVLAYKSVSWEEPEPVPITFNNGDLQRIRDPYGSIYLKPNPLISGNS